MPRAILSDPGHLIFDCPGCGCSHGINTPQAASGPKWDWNGDLDKPTISPSIKVTGTLPITDTEYTAIMAGGQITPRTFICHSFVKDGQIQFLSDCTHALAGQTVDLPEQ